MDVNTGHLIANAEKLAAEDRARYAQVPFNLLDAARAELGGRDETFVDLKRRSPLSNWAAARRASIKKAKRRKAAKSAKAARRRNR